MAMEALKSAGIKAYQGSSLKPAVQTVETAVQPQASAAVKTLKTAERVADVVEMKSERKVEAKPEKRTARVMPDKGNGSRVQEISRTKEAVKTAEPVLPENKEAEGVAANDKLKRAVEEMNKKAANSEAIFGVHDSTNRVTIKIVDKETKEILKEYPPEKTLDMIAKVWELAGLLVDEKG